MTPEQQKLLEELAELGDVNITKHTSDGNIKKRTNYVVDNSDEFGLTQQYFDDCCDCFKREDTPIDPELLERYKNAYHELVPIEPAYVSKDVYIKWLDKFASVFKSLGWYVHQEEKQYRNTYHSLAILASYFEDEEEAQKALLEFDSIDKKNEIEVLQWLTNYEDMGMRIFMMGVEFFDNDRHFQGNYISLLSTKEVYFDRRDFKVLIDFEKAYCIRYWKMFEKYNTHSREQIQIFDETSDDYNNQGSLSYHLQQREALATIGAEIPFYINKHGL